MLLAFVAMTFIGTVSSLDLVPPRDPVFMVSMRTAFGLFAALETVAALACLLVKSPDLKAAIILWVGFMVCAYQVGVHMNGDEFKGYLANIAHAFNTTPRLTLWLFRAGFLYLMAGSAATLLQSWLAKQNFSRRQKDSQMQTSANFKIPCAVCGGHIEFPASALGQEISCPHCAKSITLSRPA